MITAKTPKGITVNVQPCCYGTSNHGGKLLLGDLLLACWQACGTGLHTIEEALAYADDRIEKLGLRESVS